MTTPIEQFRSQESTALLIGKKASIVSWTIIRVPAKAFMDEAPYPVVIVKLEGGEHAIGQLVDWEEQDLRLGREVIAMLRRSGEEGDGDVINYTVKFKPV